MHYEPDNIGTLAERASSERRPKSTYSVTTDGILTVHQPGEPMPADTFNIVPGKIYIVTTDDQETATRSSIELALAMHQRVPIAYLSFAGNHDILPDRMNELDLDPEASMLIVHCLEKFSFYEKEFDKEFKRYLGNQEPIILMINMIDWAVQTDRHRQRLASELGQFADRYGCAIIVYTMEPVTRIRKARENGRGWMGTLAKLAQRTISYIPNVRPSDRPNAYKTSEDASLHLATPTFAELRPIPLHDNQLPPACKLSAEPIDDRPARIRYRAPGWYCEPRTPLEKMPYEQLTRIPIEMKFHQNDWYKPWAIESKWISKIVRELEFKKKNGLLRMDQEKLKEYQADYPNFYKKFKEMYCAETGEEEIISM